MSGGEAALRPSSVSRAPAAALRPFVEQLWVVDRSGVTPPSRRERVLPTGGMHLALSLTGEPFRISAETGGSCVAQAVVGGARSGPYLRDLPGPRRSVGVRLRPGAGEWLFGVPAHALGRFEVACEVGEVVRETGYSHRRFIALFSRAVGLTPKRYGRVLRFRRALRLLAAQPSPDLASLAYESGYSDRAHFSREFRELAGMSPREYRRLSPFDPHHVPLPAR